MIEILMLIVSYFLGAIPFGFLIMMWTERRDIRTVGSGNIGATNVLRSGKKWKGILTLLLDGGKGALAVLITGWFVGGDAEWVAIWQSLAALMAVFGHIFTVFLHFKGGKG